MNQPEIILVYDEECPACRAYSRMVRIRKEIGVLKIINAREQSDIRDRITAAGLDIDQGMVLELGGRLYHGRAAMHILALISSRTGWLNRLNYWLFKSRMVSAIVYPVLLSLRNLLLRLRGVRKINNTDRGTT